MAGARHQGIIVLGAPRSGTTLVRRLLDAHPDIACPGETGLLAACARFLEGERVVDGGRFDVVSGLSYAGFEPQETLSRLRRFAFGFHEEYAARQGKHRWAEKTATDVFHLPEIERLCGGHAYFVCVFRHGMDTVASMKEHADRIETYLRELHAYVRRHARALEAFAWAWRDATESMLALAARRPDDVVTLRYEDLVARPQEELSRVLECLGAEWKPGLLDSAMASSANVGFGDWKTYGRVEIDAASVGRGEAFSRVTAGELARIVNPALEAAGYEALPVPPEQDEDEARRRYEIGLRVAAMRTRSGGSP